MCFYGNRANRDCTSSCTINIRWAEYFGQESRFVGSECDDITMLVRLSVVVQGKLNYVSWSHGASIFIRRRSVSDITMVKGPSARGHSTEHL